MVSISSAESLTGLEFNADERELMLEDLEENLSDYQTLRNIPVENSNTPALLFHPHVPGIEQKMPPEFSTSYLQDKVKMPEDPEDLAFYPVTALAHLIRTRKITSAELTKLYLARLKKYGPKLHCVITLTENLALDQARQADKEIARGHYKGPLHGIPYGAKDLLAVQGYKTTWGAVPYKDQVIEENATVIQRLKNAGAVLAAKLSMGALAWGDVWFGGKTRNPWDLEQGSSGSSAGSASATAAGLVGFSIGTETWGSIISPCTRCGVTGLRPTFGRVSRTGAMALSWSMDKIGPICRSVEDCALVFDAIQGPDGIDPTVVDRPFHGIPQDIRNIRIGYLKQAFEDSTRSQQNDLNVLDVLRSLGVDLIPLDTLTHYPVRSLSFILSAEAAAAFDDLTRSNRDSLLVRQAKNAWPNVFRASRFIPAVEYIQANRIRKLIMKEVAEKLKGIDVFVCPTFGADVLLLTNLTGHPSVVVPNGFDETGHPTSITFVGNLFEEEKTLAVARMFQNATDFHLERPELN
jgi:Asp-tRNA(Asn)/Glu-tRNA(Gln) amidotransferase A subunit family amidase